MSRGGDVPTRSSNGVASDLLLWCFRAARGLSEEPPSVRGVDEPELASLLTYHRGWTLLGARGDALDVPEPFLALARERRQRAVQRQLLMEADLRLCGGGLEAAGIPWLCVKGPVLAAMYERRGELREFSDLDMLVPPAKLADALRVLDGLGAGLLSRNFTLMRNELPGEVAVRAPLGTVLDVHWSLVNRTARRRLTQIPTDRLLAQRVDADLGNPVPVLPEELALVHVCLHAAFSGATRLLWLLDVAYSSDSERLDWDRVVHTAQGWGMGAAVGLVLHRSRRLLDAAVPAEVITRLVGRRWRWADTVVRPTAARLAAGPQGWPAHIVVGATEYPSVTGMVGNRLRRRALGQRSDVFVQSADDAGSTLFPSGTGADLEAYLAAVAAQRV